MDLDKANKWWIKATEKHQLKESHHPKAHRRFEVKTQDSSYVPKDGRRREKVMP